MQANALARALGKKQLHIEQGYQEIRIAAAKVTPTHLHLTPTHPHLAVPKGLCFTHPPATQRCDAMRRNAM